MRKKTKITIAIIIVIFATIITLSYLTLSTKPIHLKPLNTKEMMISSISLNSKIAKIVKSVENSQPTNTTQKMVFNKDEVNAIILMGLGKAQQYAIINQSNEIINPSLKFDNDYFTITFAKKLTFSTPFGKFVNITLNTIPCVNNGVLSVKLQSAYLGSLKVPAFIVDSYLQNAVSKVNKNIIAQNIFNTIQSAFIKNNTVEIVYYPKKVSLLLSLFTFGKM